jgi:hypothetical protein
MGGKEHGLYVSSTPSSAAKKAVTKLCAANKSKKVEFSIREITQGSKKKTYGPYSGHLEKLKDPIELKGRVIKYKPVAKLQKKEGAKKGGGLKDTEVMKCWINLGHDHVEITNQFLPYNNKGYLKINYLGILVKLMFANLNDVKEGQAFIIDADADKEICDVSLLNTYHNKDGRFGFRNNKNGTRNNKEAALRAPLQLAEFGLINLVLEARREFFENIVDNHATLFIPNSIQRQSDKDKELFFKQTKKEILRKREREEIPNFCNYIYENQLKDL